MKISTLPTLIVLALAPFAISAAPGALEINQDCVAVGCFAGDTAGYPVDITQPGSYILTSDLASPGNASLNAINVVASPVDIDLNGHTISGGEVCTGSPVTSCTTSTGYRGVQFGNSGNPGVFHLHNGTISGFGSGGVVIFDSGDGTLLDHLTVTQNNFGALIVGSSAQSTTRIRDSQFVRNLNDGLTNANGPTQLFIENSTAVGNSSVGFSLGSGSVAVGNRISSNGDVGVQCGGAGSFCALGQNTFSGNNGGGSAAQFQVTVLRDMGGNVCMDDGTCP